MNSVIKSIDRRKAEGAEPGPAMPPKHGMD